MVFYASYTVHEIDVGINVAVILQDIALFAVCDTTLLVINSI